MITDNECMPRPFQVSLAETAASLCLGLKSDHFYA